MPPSKEVLMTTSPAGPLAALDPAPVWLNAEPLTAAALHGHVVLVEFWTYSCVNWLRTLPYVRAWHERYRERGLVVIGVHAPEFGFEHDLGNVRRAASDLAVGYPVVIDNDFAIWRAFGNRYWPALYLLDGDGLLRYHHFGEEAYEETERAIQALLGLDEPLADVEADGLFRAADWGALQSPETYLRRTPRGVPRALNEWTLTGAWSLDAEAAVLDEPGGSIAYRFQARDVNLVLASPARFSVRLDGEPPGSDHGVDADASGTGAIAAPRMYQLVRQHGPVRPRTFEVTFDDPGVHAYVFTFG
jgi:thiol-disulfide isomerase/thioredoxin